MFESEEFQMYDRRRYLIQQSLASAVISSGMGSLILVLTYHGQAELSVWGARGLILDCLPHGFMVGLMSVVPASLSARRALKRGAITPEPYRVAAFLPKSLILRAVVIALSSMTTLTIAAAALAAGLGSWAISFDAALIVKAFASCGLALLITPLALKSALADEAST